MIFSVASETPVLGDTLFLTLKWTYTRFGSQTFASPSLSGAFGDEEDSKSLTVKNVSSTGLSTGLVLRF